MTGEQGWIVLRWEGENLWRQITAIVASSRQEAVDIATSEGSFTEGVFQAVPIEEWGHEIQANAYVRALRNLVEALRAQDAELIGNDLGNALDEAEALL